MTTARTCLGMIPHIIPLLAMTKRSAARMCQVWRKLSPWPPRIFSQHLFAVCTFEVFCMGTSHIVERTRIGDARTPRYLLRQFVANELDKLT
jgi:hypothetical protein